MEARSSARIRNGEGYSYVSLRGVIDEDNKLASLREQLTGEVVILDLAEVERINSYGVRDWVNWLNDLKAGGHRLVMVRCSTAIIAQANMVTNFCAGALIVSFHAPYYDPSADKAVDRLLSVEEFLGKAPYKAPTFYDEHSGEELEFDDFEESYFSFISTMEGRSIDEHLKGLLADATPALMEKLHALGQGGSGQLSGPVHTANLGGQETPVRSEGFPGLLASARDVERAQDKVRVPAQEAAAVHGVALSPEEEAAATQLMKARAPMPAPQAPSAAPAPGGGSWVPYALIGVAMVVVAVLLYLVLTIQ